ncbi:MULTISPECIES: RNA-binding domain-containing protein [Aequorivita]|uniref:DNA binding domain-containing protein n=1 Tax=Aequorivita iocasae TaxID=2803865 RepID=A0ABX7DSG8_9FLAO|nr:MULTISPECIES: RNA-binding domain-containing protein [Aequorivita]QQX76493.1 putative DNA binding domain-containing protein [Aequorivita iocasae]UCA55965.1 putative DNA binding domain-containing protein [Aequorivita sp. F7]
MPETNRIEYKRELSDGLEKEVVAFLNYREGGIVYIGVDKNGNTYGLADADGGQLKIKDRLKNNIRPSAMGLFDIVSEVREGKDILKVIVASGPEKPYHLKKYGMSEKGCFIRLGSAAEPMPQKMIDELFASRTRNSISKIKANRQDLTFSQLKIYYQESGYNLGNNFAKNLELLTEDGLYNYAAYLLADKNNTSIKVAKYSGANRADLIESNEYGHESLVKATKQVIDKIAVENRTNTKITSKERKQNNLWNPIALREAIINAFVHNDYTNEITPKFEIFSDRIEITSAGGLPEGLSKQEFFEGFSVPRNKELMRVFKDLELVEQLGSGIPRILEHYGKESFSFSENFLRMTFMAKETAVNKDDADGNEIGGQMGGQKGGQINKETEKAIDANSELTQRQKQILKLIYVDNRISRSGIAEVLHINESAIQKHLNNLKEAGYIERIGGTRGYWQVNVEDKS